jgi:hypothetical protein
MSKKDKCKKGGWGAWEKIDWKTGDWVWEKLDVEKIMYDKGGK